MSKHRPATPPKAPGAPSPGPAKLNVDPDAITADSSGLEISRAKAAMQLEIYRRQSYQEFLALKAQFDQLPPIAPPTPVSAEED